MIFRMRTTPCQVFPANFYKFIIFLFWHIAGISLSVDQWEKLKDVMEVIDERIHNS